MMELEAIKPEKTLSFDHVPPFYLDYNATTPLSAELCSYAQLSYQKFWNNPSALYKDSELNSQLLKNLRVKFSRLLSPDAKVVFTASATEALNLVINSLPEDTILTSEIEHSAVKKCISTRKDQVYYLNTKDILLGNLELAGL
ncbi:MAG: aminotransferase class V-fold PLP-dependent enzyme, partial [Bdellovibrionaceae bacterium]|nr:aminotransferase class V-fold PLP-dependent enzyme [Pseudobdellovibrionaceae bacterium]